MFSKSGSGLWFVGLALFTSTAVGQVSGIPGDQVPDFYYFATDAKVETSVGPVSRPAGTLLMDTDGTDAIAMLIGGPDATTNCELCEMPNLPDPNPPFFASSWAAGFINGSTQFIRTAPIQGVGFEGVIGEYEDPFGIFPDFGITNYGPGLTANDFDSVFIDDNGEFWEVIYGRDVGPNLFTNVTVIPEPTSLLGLLAGCMMLSRMRNVR